MHYYENFLSTDSHSDGQERAATEKYPKQIVRVKYFLNITIRRFLKFPFSKNVRNTYPSPLS